MLVIEGEGFALELLDLETCTRSRMRVGRVLDEVYVWDARGQLVQALLLVGETATSVLTESSDGRPTLIAAETLDEGERLRPMHVRAFDLLTGVVRWRRSEKLHAKLGCFTHRDRPVVHVEAPHEAHLFDVDTGVRVRASAGELAGLRMRSHRKPPAGLALPPVELMPRYTTRRDLGGARESDDGAAITAARRAYFFDSQTTTDRWARTEASPLVLGLVDRLRALEGKPPLSGEPPHGEVMDRPVDLPPDVRAIVASGSATLASRWGIGTDHLSRLEQVATSRRAPRRVRAFGEESRPENSDAIRMLCAQATSLGDRVGIYNGLGYLGPFPIETLLSETWWSVLEHRQQEARDADAHCAMMAGPVRTLLEIAAATR